MPPTRSAAAAVVVGHVPVVGLEVVDVPGARAPLVAADVGEVVVNIVRDAGVGAVVELVAVPVAVGAAGVADLGAAGDVEGTAARALEGLGALHGGEVDLLERGARRVVAVAAVAAGGPGDAGRAEPGGRLGVGELGDHDPD